MEESFKTDELTSTLKKYVNKRYELLNLELSAKLAHFGAWLFSGSILALAFVFALLFGSVGAAFYLSVLFKSYTSGFILVSAFYFALFLLLALIRRNTIHKPLRDRLVNELLKGSNQPD